MARLGGYAAWARLSALLRVVLADDGPVELVAWRQRLGQLPHSAVATEEARCLACDALGTAAGAAGDDSARITPICRSPPRCRGSAASGGRASSLAWGARESRWPVLRFGYGMYFGRTANATLENALTQTGSLKGDLNFFMRPTDNLNTGGAPPFPYVLAGEPATVVKPGAVEFAPAFRNGEVHQAAASVEETLPGHVHVEASAMASLGRRLPVTDRCEHRSGSESADHHLRRGRWQRLGSDQDFADHRSILCVVALGPIVAQGLPAV